MPRLSLAKLERHLLAAADRLRQEGLDAATYKDYILGMIFLKRCSDVFDAEHERIVGRKTAQGMKLKQAQETYGEKRTETEAGVLEGLTRLKSGLMTDLLTGRFRVPPATGF